MNFESTPDETELWLLLPSQHMLTHTDIDHDLEPTFHPGPPPHGTPGYLLSPAAHEVQEALCHMTSASSQYMPAWTVTQSQPGWSQ